MTESSISTLSDISTATLTAVREAHVIGSRGKAYKDCRVHFATISDINGILYERKHGRRFDLRPTDERIIDEERKRGWSTE